MRTHTAHWKICLMLLAAALGTLAPATRASAQERATCGPEETRRLPEIHGVTVTPMKDGRLVIVEAELPDGSRPEMVWFGDGIPDGSAPPEGDTVFIPGAAPDGEITSVIIRGEGGVALLDLAWRGDGHAPAATIYLASWGSILEILKKFGRVGLRAMRWLLLGMPELVLNTPCLIVLVGILVTCGIGATELETKCRCDALAAQPEPTKTVCELPLLGAKKAWGCP
jgi:hypothetical protein